MSSEFKPMPELAVKNKTEFSELQTESLQKKTIAEPKVEMISPAELDAIKQQAFDEAARKTGFRLHLHSKRPDLL